MLVSQLLSEARRRLIVIGIDAQLIDAARALSGPPGELVVVCDSDGKAAGVITKADVVRQITHCQGAACRMVAASAMTRDVVSCRSDEPLTSVWSKMKQHGLRHIPVLDDRSRPTGVINARDALQALLGSAASEVELLRDYVMSVGYH